MPRTFFLLLLLTLPGSLPVIGQTALTTRQTLVHYIEPAGLVITEPVERGMTLYAISRRYHISIDSILSANADLDPRYVPLGYPLIVPLHVGSITQQLPGADTPAIPLSYRVQPRETLYRIAKVYLGVGPEAITALNPTIGDVLPVGQVLHIGWYIPGDNPAPGAAESPLAAEVANTPVHDVTAAYRSEGAVIHEQKGLAVWKPGNTGSQYFVLHPTARIGSYMEVTNPMLHRTLTAKVAGHITPGLYPGHVGLVVSPSLARALGVLDQQFFASWRFVE